MAEKFTAYGQAKYAGPRVIPGGISEKEYFDLNADMTKTLADIDSFLAQVLEKGGAGLTTQEKNHLDYQAAVIGAKADVAKAIAAAQASGNSDRIDRLQIMQEHLEEKRQDTGYTKSDAAKAMNDSVLPLVTQAAAGLIGQYDEKGNIIVPGIKELTPETWEGSPAKDKFDQAKRALNAQFAPIARTGDPSDIRAGQAVVEEALDRLYGSAVAENPGLKDLLTQDYEAFTSTIEGTIPETAREEHLRALQAQEKNDQWLVDELVKEGVRGSGVMGLGTALKGIRESEVTLDKTPPWDRMAATESGQMFLESAGAQKADVLQQKKLLAASMESSYDPMTNTIRQYDEAFGPNFGTFADSMNFKGDERERKQRAIEYFVKNPEKFRLFEQVHEKGPVDQASLASAGFNTSRIVRGIAGAGRGSAPRTSIAQPMEAMATKPTEAPSPESGDAAPKVGPSKREEVVDRLKAGMEPEPAPPQEGETAKADIYEQQAKKFGEDIKVLEARKAEALAALARKREPVVV